MKNKKNIFGSLISQVFFSAFLFVSIPLSLANTPAEEPAVFSPAPLKFADIQTHILGPNCLDCHTKPSRKKPQLLTLEDYTQGKKVYVIARDPDNSMLMKMITGIGAKLMPPADNADPLTPAQIETVRQWILDGALP